MTHKSRVLSQRTRRARIEHICDNCETRIFPTDLYDVTVQLIENGGCKFLRVRKEHSHPSCPYNPDDEEGRNLTSRPIDLPIAA